MEDLISVIVPVYNVEKYLEKCLISVINQTYKNLEIILIDDGSTDNSGKICDEYAKKDKRIIVIHKENDGVSSARNKGLEMAKGKYIGFIDSDDYIDSNMYEMMYYQMKKDDIDLVICEAKTFKNYKNLEKIQKVKKSNILELQKIDIIKHVFPNFPVWKMLFKKEKIKDIKFDVNMSLSEDLKFIYEYLSNIEGNAIYINKQLYNYCRRQGSLSNLQLHDEESLQKMLKIKEIAKELESDIERNFKQDDLIHKIRQKILIFDWNIIYECLYLNKNIDMYYQELYENKKYFTDKDKFYFLLLKINPKLFKITHTCIRKIKNN